MNGRTHAVIGVSVTLPMAINSGIPLLESAILASIAAGFSIGPDIDHPNSTISKSTGKTAHAVFHGMATVARNALATPYDRRRFEVARSRGIDPSHRGLTHTALFAAVMGLVGLLFGQSAFATSVLAALCAVSCRKFFPRRLRVAVIAVAACMAIFGPSVPISPEAVALAAFAGWTSHIVADACTTGGVPLMWPIRVKGRYWWRLRILGGWLKSGEKKEYIAALGVTVGMNLPYFLFLME